MQLELLESVTEFLPVNDLTNVSADGCTSIAFQNQSSDDYDGSGKSVGYRMVINNLWEILPGRALAFSQNIGFKDTSIYRISFKGVTGIPSTATKFGVVARVNTKQKC
jgi:hypothetical protein